jgi:hypothetical protein
MGDAAEPDDAIIDLTHEPAPKPDPCVEALVQHLPPMDDPSSTILARSGLRGQVEWMRQFLHVSPIGRPGRRKGSGLKEHTLEAFELYKQGYTEGQIGQHFELSKDELRKLMARIRAMKSRLPEEERRAFARAHWAGRSPTRKRKAP